MGSSSDDFTALRALLKVKRYEQPPPRHLDELSGKVLERLSRPELRRRRSVWEWLGFETDLRGALLYGFGAAVCAVVLGAVGYSLVHPSPSPSAPLVAGAALLGNRGLTSAPTTAHLLTTDTAPAVVRSSTNPLLSTEGVGFPIEGFRIHATPAKYEP
jgi:hypothetical protein